MELNFKKRTLFALPVIALAYISYASIANLSFADDAKKSAPAQHAPQAMPVDTQIVEQTSSRLWKDFFGHLRAVNFVQIRPQVSGIITKINFADGQFVNKGDVLYIIDPRPYKAMVAQREASLNSAKNNYVLAEKELKRSNNLLKKKMISEQVFDESANKKLIAKSAIKAAEAELLEAKINLTYTTIKAPISGRINRTHLTEGNLASSANSPLLTSIVSTGNIYADFEIDEDTYITYLQSALNDKAALATTPVELRLQSSDAVYQGKLHSVDNRINPATGTIGVRAIFDNSNSTLVPGMFARIKLGSSAKHEQVLVSERAIGTDQNRKFVYVIDDGKATYRPITLGDSVNGQKIVKSGLKQGDVVITSNLVKLRPNSPVMAKPAPSDSTK